jgi:Cu-Zn family superoxide dismutase
MFRTTLLTGCFLAMLAFNASTSFAQAQHADAKDNNREQHHDQDVDPSVQEAVCVLVPVAKSQVQGTIRFSVQGDSVHIHGEIRGLTPGKHGFHIHDFGDLSDQGEGKSAGGHFSPEHQPHGRPSDAKRHAGDFGNIEADKNGVAKIDFKDAVVKLSGPQAVIGRAIVVHAKKDKFTQPSGDAGDRVAFGVIGIANATTE